MPPRKLKAFGLIQASIVKLLVRSSALLSATETYWDEPLKTIAFPDVGGRKLKVLAEVPVPPEVVTEMVPVVPLPTTAVMLVGLSTVKEVAAVPPKLTSVAPVKLVPVIETDVPANADVGVNEVMVGEGGIYVKESAEVAESLGKASL